MRVLHVDTGRAMRGGQWQVLRLVEGLAAQGHEPILLAPSNSPLLKAVSERALSCRALNLLNLLQLAKSADLVHAHDAQAHTLTALFTRKPLVVARRVAFPLQNTFLSRWKYGMADHYIAVSQHVRNVLITGGVPADKISVVYDGVPALDEIVSAGDLVVAPAANDPAKGTLLLKRAAELAGAKVYFSRHLQEDLYRAALFAYISYSEGLGSAILLAMAAGIPVVASRVGGIPELVENGRTGLLVDNCEHCIADALKLLLGDEKLRQALAARARLRVSERFSASIMIRDTLKVYDRVLSC